MRGQGRQATTLFEQKREQMIEHLEQALAVADELKDSLTGYLIECASDEARAGVVTAFPGTKRQWLARQVGQANAAVYFRETHLSIAKTSPDPTSIKAVASASCDREMASTVPAQRRRHARPDAPCPGNSHGNRIARLTSRFVFSHSQGR